VRLGLTKAVVNGISLAEVFWGGVHLITSLNANDYYLQAEYITALFICQQ
jgi:hypothetical protein